MSDQLPTAPDSLQVAVRVLCAFTAQAGDLDLRFTPSPTAQDGVAGHEAVTARRAAPYQREVPLRSRFGDLLVQGRADGFDPDAPRLEEIKTHRGDVALVRGNHRALHWAQARVYAWMLCEQLGLERIEVALVYFNIDTRVETVLAAWNTADELRLHFNNLCSRYLGWARSEEAHRHARDAQLHTLAFPFNGFRAGQRELAGATWRTHRHGRHLLVQAPTGIGKTMATLFGALKAMPARDTDKLLYLTAKTPGRRVALDALVRLQPHASVGRLRVLERVAREKACEHPDKACHGDACPLASGFYDRLPAAREEAAQTAWLDQAGLRTVALRHQVCPYYLGQDMLRWSDVVVGDFNHFFDLSAHAWALTVGEPWRVGLLVDEAHNLIERARLMYSAELDPLALVALRKAPPQGLKGSLDRLHRFWGTLGRDQATEQVLINELPDGLVGALQQHAADLSEHLALDTTAPDVRVQAWLFEVLHFIRVAEVFGDHSLVEITRAGPNARGRAQRPRLAIRNLVPAPHLQPRWQAAHSATLFSATLSPMEHAIHLLGLPQDVARLEVPSPFDPAQLRVRITPHISTRYQDRAESLDAVVAVMAGQFHARPGNYLAFFSSFDYLQQVLARFALAHPDIAAWSQSRGMSEPDRIAFVARFTEASQGVGFAVLGGAFGEGLDLPGQRLIGAFIATLGLPQVNPLNEQLRARLQLQHGRGYDHAYLFPGLQKVVQAAGRVIRGPEDKGVVVLMDDRFARPEVRGLLPAWWHIERG